MAGELPGGARSGKRTRSRWAHANTASNNGTTRRGFWQHDLHRLHVLLPVRQLAQDRKNEGCGHAAAGSLLRTPDFPTRGVSPHFDVAMSRTFCRTRSGARRIFATRSLVRGHQTARSQSSPDKFLFTKIPLPSEPTVTERACGRRPCRVPVPCVQLVASHFQGEQPDPRASKITVYLLHLRNPPALRSNAPV